MLLAYWWQQQSSPIAVSAGVVDCQPAQGTCSVETKLGRLQWTVKHDIQYLKPFMSQVRLSNSKAVNISRASIEFLMQGMEMAANRSVLQQQSKNQWQAQSILPVCASGRKDWLGVVRLESQKGVWQASFRFKVPADEP